MKPRSVEEWFQLVPDLLSRKTWTLACARNQAQLFHKECPWGGRLGKIELEGIDFEGAVVLRPEVWQSYLQLHPEQGMRSELQKLIGPGEAILRISVDWMPCRQTNALFGKFEDCLDLSCFRGAPMRCNSSRDFPQPGDSGLTVQEATGPGVQRLAWLRPEAHSGCRMVLGWWMPEDEFGLWATFSFLQFLDLVKKSYLRFFQLLTAKQAMTLEREFYLCLTMKHFQGGNPLVPAAQCGSDSCVDVSRHWEHFGGAFRLADYLKVFLARLGEELCIFDSMDGRQLAPHQCLVRRDQWQQVRGRFWAAFWAQGAAYRRCNGGRNAPAICEDDQPELLSLRRPQGPAQTVQAMLIIRKTFWHAQAPSRSLRRRHTVSLPLRDCAHLGKPIPWN